MNNAFLLPLVKEVVPIQRLFLLLMVVVIVLISIIDVLVSACTVAIILVLVVVTYLDYKCFWWKAMSILLAIIKKVTIIAIKI